MFAFSTYTLFRQVFGPLSHPVSRMSKEISNLSENTFSPNLPINRMVWIDMEMTGLDIEKDKIMEVACLITDSDLNVIAESPDIIIHHSEDIINNMNEWCIKHHRKTGLSDACLNSKVSLEEAENTLLDFVKNYVTDKCSPLAGNSVYIDRLFLNKFMPKLDACLHYRIIDVSSVKELCRRWNPKVFEEQPKKEFSHRALSDIRESVAELKYYKETFFKCS